MVPHERKLPINEIPLNHREEWMIENLKAAHLRMRNEGLCEPQDIRWVVEFPEWDFIHVKNYIHPVLHDEIGLVNDALDGFYNVLDENVEIMSDEEKWQEIAMS
jgi:hypothetical protein